MSGPRFVLQAKRNRSGLKSAGLDAGWCGKRGRAAGRNRHIRRRADKYRRTEPTNGPARIDRSKCRWRERTRVTRSGSGRNARSRILTGVVTRRFRGRGSHRAMARDRMIAAQNARLTEHRRDGDQQRDDRRRDASHILIIAQSGFRSLMPPHARVPMRGVESQLGVPIPLVGVIPCEMAARPRGLEVPSCTVFSWFTCSCSARPPARQLTRCFEAETSSAATSRSTAARARRAPPPRGRRRSKADVSAAKHGQLLGDGVRGRRRNAGAPFGDGCVARRAVVQGCS